MLITISDPISPKKLEPTAEDFEIFKKEISFLLHTMDIGPSIDDMALFLIQSDKLIVIPSEHSAFFDIVSQLNIDFPIDFNQFIAAQSSTLNQEFILRENNPWHNAYLTVKTMKTAHLQR